MRNFINSVPDKVFGCRQELVENNPLGPVSQMNNNNNNIMNQTTIKKQIYKNKNNATATFECKKFCAKKR